MEIYLFIKVVCANRHESSQLLDFDELISIAIRAEIALALLIRLMLRLLLSGGTAFQRVQRLGELSGNRFVIIALLVESVILIAIGAIPAVSVAVRDDRVLVAEPAIDSDRESRSEEAAEKGGGRDAASPDQRRRQIKIHIPFNCFFPSQVQDCLGA